MNREQKFRTMLHMIYRWTEEIDFEKVDYPHTLMYREIPIEEGDVEPYVKVEFGIRKKEGRTTSKRVGLAWPTAYRPAVWRRRELMAKAAKIESCRDDAYIEIEVTLTSGRDAGLLIPRNPTDREIQEIAVAAAVEAHADKHAREECAEVLGATDSATEPGEIAVFGV